MTPTRILVLPLALGLAALAASPAAASNGHAGKIIFSTTPITVGKEAPATQFKLSQPIFWRVYSERTAADQVELEKKKCSFNTEHQPQRGYRVWVDGIEQKDNDFGFDTEDVGERQWKSETTWTEKTPLNGAVKADNVSFNSHFVHSVVSHLQPGNHVIKIVALVYCPAEWPRFVSRPMAEGSFTVSVAAADVAAITAPQDDLPAAVRKDPKLAAQAVKIMNQYWKHAGGRHALKAVIVERDWSVERNEITGIVISRSIDTVVAYEDNKGCHFYGVRLRQDAQQRGRFGQTYFGSEDAGETDIACAKVK